MVVPACSASLLASAVVLRITSACPSFVVIEPSRTACRATLPSSPSSDGGVDVLVGCGDSTTLVGSVTGSEVLAALGTDWSASPRSTLRIASIPESLIRPVCLSTLRVAMLRILPRIVESTPALSNALARTSAVPAVPL